MNKKCEFCGCSIKDVKLPLSIIKDNGQKIVIEIDAMFCEEDKEYYITEDTEKQINNIKAKE